MRTPILSEQDHALMPSFNRRFIEAIVKGTLSHQQASGMLSEMFASIDNGNYATPYVWFRDPTLFG
ncbi:hypothetical protein [Dickeya sp. NCPPB 3274]|uniref:hypothetical protein n=1 Tax=Dickeya sp. NCPPB 3274 TaxID=568766 RepID=UPI00039A2521|nr:hypothetical protein [Dickeya sp. NCPPB 3274]